MSPRRLAEVVKEGIRAPGATPVEVNTIAISDGVVARAGCDKTLLKR